MAKKKAEEASSSAKDGTGNDARPSDNASPDIDQAPEVAAAETAVRRAEAELKRAKELYGQVRQQAVDQFKRVRETRVADVVDGTLQLVKKHPGAGVAIAAAIGFFLGRLFRR